MGPIALPSDPETAPDRYRHKNITASDPAHNDMIQCPVLVITAIVPLRDRRNGAS